MVTSIWLGQVQIFYQLVRPSVRVAGNQLSTMNLMKFLNWVDTFHFHARVLLLSTRRESFAAWLPQNKQKADAHETSLAAGAISSDSGS